MSCPLPDGYVATLFFLFSFLCSLLNPPPCKHRCIPLRPTISLLLLLLQDLEVYEAKSGFIPGHDPAAFRVRRRYRLLKGGYTPLVLVHYTRGNAIRTSSILSNPH